MDLPEPDLLVDVGGGRRIALDDRGDPDGSPVLFLHGTPDSRLARHPDDRLAADAGVRLIAVDRPGIGASDPDPTATPTSVADDLDAVLDGLGIERAGVLAWSAGSIAALAFAGRHPGRVRSLTLVAPLVPADAYGSPGVLDGADDSRRLFASLLDEMGPDELGVELAMWLVPPAVDEATARAMLEASLGAVASEPGAGDQLVHGLRASVATGLGGVERDIAAQATPLGAVLDAIGTPIRIHVGDTDPVAPPAMSRWLATRLAGEIEIHARAGHALAITAWARFLVDAGR